MEQGSQAVTMDILSMGTVSCCLCRSPHVVMSYPKQLLRLFGPGRYTYVGAFK